MFKWVSSNGVAVKQILTGFYNVYFVSYKELTILVDTGRKFKQKLLLENISNELNSSKKALNYLFLTHTHYDHCDNAYAVKRKYKCDVIVQKLERDFLENGSTPLPVGTNPFTYFLTKLGNRYATHWYYYHKLKPDIIFDKKLTLTETDNMIHLVHTPGHSRGSSSMIIDNEFAIVGDSMFGSKRSVYPHFADDKKLLIKTWEYLLSTKCSLFFTGHGSPRRREQFEKDYLRHKKFV